LHERREPKLTSSIDLATRLLVLSGCPLASNDPGYAACLSQRTAGLTSMFAESGMFNTVVTTEADFARELRSGRWNAYWISSGAMPTLSVATQSELGQALFRKEWIVLDHPRAAASSAAAYQTVERLTPVAGDALTDSPFVSVSVAESSLLPQGVLTIQGSATKYTSDAVSAEELGRFAVDSGGANAGPTPTAAIRRVNRTIVTGFDLYAALQNATPAYRSSLVRKVLAGFAPTSDGLVRMAGGYAHIRATLVAGDAPTSMSLGAPLPTGSALGGYAVPSDFAEAPTGMAWLRSLAAGETFSGMFELQLGPVPIRYAVHVAVEASGTESGGQAWGPLTEPVVIDSRDIDSQLGLLDASLNTLPASQIAAARTKLQQVAAQMSNANYVLALNKLLELSDSLDDAWRLDYGADTVSPEIGLLVQGLGIRLNAAPPSGPPDGSALLYKRDVPTGPEAAATPRSEKRQSTEH
jgi:hypothetical protein